MINQIDEEKQYRQHAIIAVFSYILHPLPLVGTIVFIALISFYPIFNTVLTVTSHYLFSVPWLRLDLTGMHALSDIMACIFGTWCSVKACAPKSLINPPWCTGYTIKRYAVIILKGALLSSMVYCLSVVPMIIYSCDQGFMPDLWLPLLFGAVVPAAMFAVGFAIGVIVANKWALIVAALFAVALICWSVYGGLMSYRFPQGKFMERAWGGQLATVLPFTYTGIGPEPGLRMNLITVLLRIFFVCVILLGCIAACSIVANKWALCAGSWRLPALAVLTIIPLTLGSVIACCGPRPWLRSRPFTPICITMQNSAFTVCSHPEDGVHHARAVRQVKRLAKWFPSMESDKNSTKFIFALGNAFTPITPERSWNLNKESISRFQAHNTIVFQQLTDTVSARTSEYSALEDILPIIVRRLLPAQCAQSELSNIQNKKMLNSNESIAAFIVDQLPRRIVQDMRDDINVSLPYAARDKIALAINEADLPELRAFVYKHFYEINQCKVNTHDVLAELKEVRQ